MTPYEKWRDGSLTGLGPFQVALFKAYTHADGGNTKKLQAAYPEWFTEKLTVINRKVWSSKSGLDDSRLYTFLIGERVTVVDYSYNKIVSGGELSWHYKVDTGIITGTSTDIYDWPVCGIKVELSVRVRLDDGVEVVVDPSCLVYHGGGGLVKS